MSDTIFEKLHALTSAYALLLPGLVNEIESGWLHAKSNGDKDQLAILARQAHTLCGTSGTYGYILVSDVARRLENNFNQFLRSVNPEQLEHDIDNLLQDLKQVILNPPEKNIEKTFSAKKKSSDNRGIYILDKSKMTHSRQWDQIKQVNYRVKVFDDVDEFLLTVIAEKPDMVIIEVDFTKDIPLQNVKKMLEDFTLILYMGNKDNLMNRLDALRHGGMAYIVKPFEVNALLQTVDDLFEAKKTHNERILIVDDSEFLAEYYTMLVNNAGMIGRKVTNPMDFLPILQEFQPDLILMDINMPFCSGTELAQIVHQQESLSGIPIIFLSTISEKSIQLEVLSFAGDDFMTKPVEPKYLLATIHNRLVRSHRLRSRIARDSLTNLYNHTMIHHQLEREVFMAKRNHQPVSVALLDIDYFKSVNDTYGHQTGDIVLKEFSLFLLGHLRKTDLIGRYGGEEFLIIFPNTTPVSAFEMVNKLRTKVATALRVIDDKELVLTMSAGIASYPEIKDTGGLIKAADLALYRAKEQGRNCVVLGDDSK